MGIFDIIELKNHCQAITEYMVYLDAHRDDFELTTTMVADHVRKMNAILDNLEKNP